MQMPALSAPRAAGLLVGLLGATLAARWVFQVDAIARLIPGAEHMGIVNPLLFIAAGLCFFNASQPPKPGAWLTRLSAVCIAALIVLPSAYLFESLTGIGLGSTSSVPAPFPRRPTHCPGDCLRTRAWRFCWPVSPSGCTDDARRGLAGSFS